MMFAYNRVHYVPMVVLVCLHIKLPHYDHYADLSEGIDLLIELTYLSDNCENIYILSYYHHQIRSMAHLPLFRARSWNIGMRYVSFYILTRLWYLESIGNRDTTVLHQAFQEMLNFGKSWICHWISIKTHKAFTKWALKNKQVWEYWPLIASCFEQMHDSYNVQYQKWSFRQALDALEQHYYCDDYVLNDEK